jgi:zinc transport system ATP-binding protein
MIVDHTKNIIEVKDVSFSYGNHKVLHNVNLCVHRGDYLGVIGPNGGGKTTLIKLILGLLKPDKGEILIFGEPVNKLRDKKRIGYVAQKVTNFDPIFPITAENVVGLGKNGDKKNIKWALEIVEMQKYSDRLIGELSGGQQQRIFIARALAQKPEIIFLDEPTTGIDASSQKEFLDFLKKLNRELDITLILISHDINIITEEASEIAYVNKTLTYKTNKH